MFLQTYPRQIKSHESIQDIWKGGEGLREGNRQDEARIQEEPIIKRKFIIQSMEGANLRQEDSSLHRPEVLKQSQVGKHRTLSDSLHHWPA